MAFGIILTFFESNKDRFFEQTIDMYCLYLLWATSTVPLLRININSKVLTIMNDFLQKCTEINSQEPIELLTLMRKQNAFSYGYITGLKTRLVGKHGKILTITETGSYVQKMKLENFGAVGCQTEATNLEKCHKDYLVQKKAFIKNFVLHDDNEIIDYDEQTRQVIKKTEREIGYVDEYSLDMFGRRNEDSN